MSVKILGISTSPRVKGNSDLLLREALAGASAAGAEVEYLSVAGMNIAGCQACNFCREEGICRIQDDFQSVLVKLLAVDHLIFATPIHFMSVCGQAKLLIDRCQCLWARKYVLDQPLFPDGQRDRWAMVIAVGATRSTNMFDCVRLTMKYWLDALERNCAANLFVNQIEDHGEILEHPEAIPEAFRLGEQLATATDSDLAALEDVELF